MRHRSVLATPTVLLLALCACGGSSSSDSSPSGDAGGAGSGSTSGSGGGAASGTSSSDAGGNGSTSGDGGPSALLAQSSVHRDPASGISSASLAGAVSANNAFAVDLFSRIRSSSGSSNLLTSPVSASLALTMAYAGAAGQTASQMATALHFGAAAGSIFDGQNALSQALGGRAAAALASDTQNATENSAPAPSPSDYQLQVVNSVWGEQTYSWEAPFLDTLAKSYGTGVYLEDFIHNWDSARQAINAWVSTETADKINNLLPSGALDDATRMVIVNAIHLKLPWASPFEVSATAPGTFTKADGTTVSPSFMNEMLTVPYADDGQAQIIELPLAGQGVAVVIALPHGDLATYETGAAPSSSGKVSTTQGAFPFSVPAQSTPVQLSLPKFTFTSATFSLATALEAMGMTQAFDPTAADFSGLCAHPPDGGHLYVKDVLQKAMMAVQETGVEAAAATAVTFDDTAAVLMPTVMTVNRPFLISIVDLTSGAILFAGHIEDPTDAGGP
jgi:serpin B